MNKHLALDLILCGTLSACSGSSPGSIPLSPDCKRNFEVITAYVDKLEATGRFPPEKIECFRRHYDKMKAAQQDPAIRALPQNTDQEKINYGCRASEKIHKMQIEKADEIPDLSQEEFDADWGKIECRYW
jgi:hypothetical protein